jgi:hypothetical protein
VNVANNFLYIDYRSNDVPVAEVGLTWKLFLNDGIFAASVNTGGNGSSGYRGFGSSTNSRIILQSPSNTNWQVRICIEPPPDYAQFSPAATLAPGFGGNSKGDFAIGGRHLHMLLWHNASAMFDVNYMGASTGFVADQSSTYYSTRSRISFWGDDTTGNLCAVDRGIPSDNHFSSDSWCAFGIPEDEELPLPVDNIHRLFCFGNSDRFGGNLLAFIFGVGHMTGCAYGLSNQPIFSSVSQYQRLDAIDEYTPVLRYDGAAGDNHYLSATELQTVDIVAGCIDEMYNTALPPVLPIEVRRLGRLPFVRLGRSNFGYFTLSTDAQNKWLHLNDGMYLPWQATLVA